MSRITQQSCRYWTVRLPVTFLRRATITNLPPLLPENTLLKSAIEQAKSSFLVQLGVTSALHTDRPPSAGGTSGEPSTAGLAPDVASSVREFQHRFLANIGAETAEKPHVLATVSSTRRGRGSGCLVWGKVAFMSWYQMYCHEVYRLKVCPIVI